MLLKNGTRVYKSIGFKITVWYSLSVFTILLIASGFLYYRLNHKLNKEVNHILIDESGDVLHDILEDTLTQNNLIVAIEKEASNAKYFKLSARLLDIDQNTVVCSANFFAPDLKTSERSITDAKNGKFGFDTIRIEGIESPYRLITRPVYIDNALKYYLQVGIYLKHTQKIVENLAENLVMLIPALVILSIFCGWFISRRSLSPIESINKATRQITVFNLHKRLSSLHTGDELDKLTNTINHMLDRLENSFKRTIQFTSDASHELRTPIAALKTGIEVTLSRDRSPEEYSRLLINNLSVLERLTSMINDLLELSRTDSDAHVLNLKSTNVSNMLMDLHKKFMLISKTRKIKILIEVEPDIHINGDEDLLRRLFSNLLGNAIKYTLVGGQVCLSLEDGESEIIVTIEDTGIGIPETKRGKIFDRFYRVDPSRTSETGGAGLGLSICKSIVALHNGTIEVKSTINVGSTFIVRLPKNHAPH